MTEGDRGDPVPFKFRPPRSIAAMYRTPTGGTIIRRAPDHRAEDGMTIIEVMVASALLLMVAAAVSTAV